MVATLASSHSSGLRLAAELAPILKGHRLNGLPKPSWDLWEERYGVHFWTVCTVVEALDSVAAATNDAEAGLIADTMWEALSTSFFSPTGEIARRLTDGVPDWTPDSSVLGGLLHCRRTSGHQLESAVSMVESHLRVNTQVGGVARYVGDYYARVDDTVPGNPWVICTCWLGQAYTRLGRIEEARQILDWVDKVGGPTGLLPEQLHPQTGESMTVQPLPWSHAEALILVNGLRGTRPSG